MGYNKTEKILAGENARKGFIMAAAVDLLAAGGWAAATSAEIAGGADVAGGLIYKYWADRRELDIAIIKHVLQRDLDALHAADDLPSGIRAWAKLCAQRPRVALAMNERVEYREGMRAALAALLRQAGVSNSALMSAIVYGAVIEAASTMKPRDEPLLISTLMKAIGVRVRA